VRTDARALARDEEYSEFRVALYETSSWPLHNTHPIVLPAGASTARS
jgi:hypothetical protein